MRKVWPNQSDLSTNSAGQIPPIGHPEAPVSTSSPSACHQKAGYGYSELPPRRLGPRHRKILDLLVLGRTNKEIARHLGISPNTVRNRLLEIFRSTGVSSRSELLSSLLDRQTVAAQIDSIMQAHNGTRNTR